MKKVICLILTIGLLLGFSGTAFADLSYEDLPDNLKKWVHPDEVGKIIDLSKGGTVIYDSDHNTSDIDDLEANKNAVLVYYNGTKVSFPDAQPFVNQDSRTLIPVRAVVEEMKCKVDWNEETQIVTISRGTIEINLKIGENKATINGVEITFDTKAEINKSRSYVPLRFVSQTLGASVQWIGEDRTVRITE